MTDPSPSPFSRKAVLHRFFSLLETLDAPPEIIEDWQSLGVLLLLWPLLEKVFVEGDRRRIPPAAFLVTLSQTEGHIAYNEGIRVRGTLISGLSEGMGFEALWSRYKEINDLTPLTPYLAYVLFVDRRLFAWDMRGALPILAHLPEVHRRLGLFSRGPKEARNHRWSAFSNLPPKERAEVVCDVLTSDIFESGRKRVPLKGMLVKGGAIILESGGVNVDFGQLGCQ
jgi:hypothetical protein